MGHLVEQRIQPLISNPWLRDAMAPFDVAGTLSAALAPAWTVEREIDPSGDLTIIILPTGDASQRSAFWTIEDNGRVHVGTIRGEIWHSTCAFPRANVLSPRLYPRQLSAPSARRRPSPQSAQRSIHAPDWVLVR